MPLGSRYGREAGGSSIHPEVLGRGPVDRWFNGSTLRGYDLLERMMINAPKNILDSEGRFEARELRPELDHRHTFMAA